MAYRPSDNLHSNDFIPLDQHVPPSPASPHYQPYAPSPNYAAHDYSNTDLPGYSSPQPRFAGNQVYQDASYASSSQSIGQHTDYNSSVYALNDKQGSLSHGYDRHSFHEQDMPMSNMGPDSQWVKDKKEATYASPRKKRKGIIICAVITLIVILVAAALVVYFVVIRPKQNGTSSSSSGGKSVKNLAITGGDNSEVVMEDGTTFTYKNSLGGHWYYDPNDPYNNNAKANSWTPALNETFRHGVDRIRG
jgi:glucan 1,3-beta-glucosidase